MTPASAREAAAREWVTLAEERIIAALAGTIAAAEYGGISWSG